MTGAMLLKDTGAVSHVPKQQHIAKDMGLQAAHLALAAPSRSAAAAVAKASEAGRAHKADGGDHQHQKSQFPAATEQLDHMHAKKKKAKRKYDADAGRV